MKIMNRLRKARGVHLVVGAMVLTDLLQSGSTAQAVTNGHFDVEIYQLTTGLGATDTQLNSLAEARGIWTALDGGAGPVVTIGPTVYNVTRYERDTEIAVNYAGGNGSFFNHTYNIQNIESGVASVIDYAGTVGSFGTNNPYTTIGGGTMTGGDQFTVSADGFLRFNNAGTYSIAVNADDGRILSLSGVTFTAVGGTNNIGGVGTDTIGSRLSGSSNTVGVFTVAAGQVAQLDSFFWEAGGGDHYEIAIKTGSDTSFGGPGDGWSLLSNGVAGVDVSTNAGFSDTNFAVKAFRILSGLGSNDSGFSTTLPEAAALWNYVDGGGTAGLTPVLVSDGPQFAYDSIDNDGSGGSGGLVVSGDDLSIRATAKLFFEQGGTYSIAVNADDGRFLELIGTVFTAVGGQVDTGGVGMNFVGQSTATAGNTVGVFTVSAGQTLEFSSLFFERGGGDLFEIAIRQGNDTSFGGPDEGWVLLQNGVFGIGVNDIPEPATGLLGLMGMAALGRRRRRHLA